MKKRASHEHLDDLIRRFSAPKSTGSKSSGDSTEAKEFSTASPSAGTLPKGLAMWALFVVALLIAVLFRLSLF